jgi:hypothetical protein
MPRLPFRFAHSFMKLEIRIIIAAVALAWCGVASSQYSDQDEPQRGGVTNWNTNSEYSFELVRGKTGLTLYIEDHEAPVPTKGAKGELVIRRSGKSTSTPLTPAGENRMLARGTSARSGDQVVATITLENGTIMMGRFAMP